MEFSNILNYILSSLGLKALGLISLPIMTRLLDPEEYGILNIFSFYTIITSSLLTFNLHSSIIRYYQFKKQIFDTYLFQIICIQSLCVIVITFISSVYKNDLYVLLNLPMNIILFFGPVIFLYVVQNWFIYYLKAKRDSELYRNILAMKQITGFITSLLFIYMLDEYKYLGRMYSELFVLLFLYFFFQVFASNNRIGVNLKQLKFMFKYSFGLLPAIIGGAIISQLDRVMIAKYISMSDAVYI